jgi:hypothetical protein
VVGRWAGSIKSKERKKELDELNDAWSRDYNRESSEQLDAYRLAVLALIARSAFPFR